MQGSQADTQIGPTIVPHHASEANLTTEATTTHTTESSTGSTSAASPSTPVLIPESRHSSLPEDADPSTDTGATPLPAQNTFINGAQASAQRAKEGNSLAASLKTGTGPARDRGSATDGNSVAASLKTGAGPARDKGSAKDGSHTHSNHDDHSMHGGGEASQGQSETQAKAPKRYTCSDCDKLFPSIQALAGHVGNAHGRGKRRHAKNNNKKPPKQTSKSTRVAPTSSTSTKKECVACYTDESTRFYLDGDGKYMCSACHQRLQNNPQCTHCFYICYNHERDTEDCPRCTVGFTPDTTAMEDEQRSGSSDEDGNTTGAAKAMAEAQTKRRASKAKETKAPKRVPTRTRNVDEGDAPQGYVVIQRESPGTQKFFRTIAQVLQFLRCDDEIRILKALRHPTIAVNGWFVRTPAQMEEAAQGLSPTVTSPVLLVKVGQQSGDSQREFNAAKHAISFLQGSNEDFYTHKTRGTPLKGYIIFDGDPSQQNTAASTHAPAASRPSSRVTSAFASPKNYPGLGLAGAAHREGGGSSGSSKRRRTGGAGGEHSEPARTNRAKPSIPTQNSKWEPTIFTPSHRIFFSHPFQNNDLRCFVALGM